MIGQRKQVTIDNSDISYIEVEGSGVPVVFLHGWGGDALSFQPLFEELSESSDARLLALDFPGFGQSTPLSHAWRLEQYALCVVKYLEELNVSQVIIVCHSFGARVITKLMSMHPECCKKIVYIAAAGIKNRSLKVRLIRQVSKMVKAILSLPLLKHVFKPIRTVGYKLIHGQDYLQASGATKQTFQHVIDEDLKPHIDKIAVPVKIFWGVHDTYVPIADGEYMHQAIANSTFTQFQDGKHGIHKTHAKQISSEIINFLE